MFIVSSFIQAMILLVNGVFQIIYWLLFARIVISWFPVDPYHQVVQFLYQMTEPILAPFRRIPLRIGLLDMTPLLAFVALFFVRNVVLGILIRLYHATGAAPAY